MHDIHILVNKCKLFHLNILWCLIGFCLLNKAKKTYIILGLKEYRNLLFLYKIKCYIEIKHALIHKELLSLKNLK